MSYIRQTLDLSGIKQGNLLIKRCLGTDGKRSLWECVCDCGNVVIRSTKQLRVTNESKKLRSCGYECRCHRETISEARTEHGMSKHNAFAVWRSMKQRCLNHKHKAYHNYGGRGISVCERWLASFENFWADMGPSYVPGLELDRTNNNGNYEPTNCRWVTAKENCNNRKR